MNKFAFAGVLLICAGRVIGADVNGGGVPAVVHAIDVPPGINKMHPTVSISHVGGMSNGVLGVGWQLDAANGIARCGATRATDGKMRHVTNTVNDKLCLNGQRLIPLDAQGNATVVGSATGDAAGLSAGAFQEFRSERDTYARIRAYGFADGSTAASGPLYFRVWTKDDKVIDYGNSPNADSHTNATILAAYPVDATTHYAKSWMVARIADTFGNFVDYKYNQRLVNWGSSGSSQSGLEWNLTEIQYSGNKVIFSYTDRSTGFPPQDGSESYASIDKTLVLNRLASVTTYINAPDTADLGAQSGAVPVQTTNFKYAVSSNTQRSLLQAIQTCTGGPGGTTCAPAETFQYTAGGDQTYVHSSAFNLVNQPLFNTIPLNDLYSVYGTIGLLTGDFNGDGRTDLIRWSNSDPSQNKLYISNGNGSFTESSTFNIKDQLLFNNLGCVQSRVEDFDGDGLDDIFVYSSPTPWRSGNAQHLGNQDCGLTPPPAASAIYHSNGDGTFTKQPITITGLDGQPVSLDQTAWDEVDYGVAGGPPNDPPGYYWGEGHVFYFLDLDGDGILDLVISIRPARPYGLPNTTISGCSGVCTRVFKGDGHGDFIEKPTNVAGVELFNSAPRYTLSGQVFDSNNDGYPDLSGGGGMIPANQYAVFSLLSRGDFNFDYVNVVNNAAPNVITSIAGTIIDYNGDGRNDGVGYIQDRASGQASRVSNFNLTANGLLTAANGDYLNNVAVDANGDGKQDFMRVNTYVPYLKYDTTVSAIYLSNGDGSFAQSSTFNMDALLAADGYTTTAPANSWVLGDFTGHGQPEVLVLTPTQNELYVKANQAPTDLLYQVTDGSGATTTFDYVPAANPFVAGDLTPRYVTDRLTSNAATGSQADVNASGYLVGAMHADNGIGGSIRTDLYYAGLKRDLLGRGSLGYREVRRQHPAADGSAVTDQNLFAQTFPYIGVPLQTNLYHGTLNSISSGNQLKSVTNVYCDQTANSGADTAAVASGVSCTSSAVSRRPYLLWSQSKTWDLAGYSLPSHTKQVAVNADGEPLTENEAATVPGSPDVFSQLTTNLYQPDDISCSAIGTCRWILGRIQRTTVASTVPSTILSTSAGSAPQASATSGTADFARITSISFGTVTVGTTPTVTQVSTVSNPGEKAVAFPVPSAASVTGTDFGFVSTTCTGTLQYLQSCTISLSFAPTAAVSRSGTLSISTNAGVLTATLAGTGAAPVLAIHPQLANWGTVGIASDSGDWPTVTNSSAVPVLITAHSVVSGPSGVWSWQGTTGYCIPGTTVLQPGTSCKTFFGGMGTSTAVGSFTATDQISYQAVGVTTSTFTVQQVYTFSTAATIANASSLTFGGTTVNTTSAQQSFTLTNNANASPVNISVSMVGNQPTNFPMTNNCGSALAAGASCTVTVSFNPTWVASGFSAAVQVATTYPRMSGGTVEAYYYAAPTFSVPVGGNGLGSVATLTSAATLTSSAAWYGQGAKSVTAAYRNDGNAPMTLASPTLAAPLSVQSNNCSNVAAGASCSMAITVATTVPGISVNQSFVPTGASVAPAAEAVNWTTQTSVVSWSPTLISFGAVPVGTSVSQNLTLTNTGNTAYNWATSAIDDTVVNTTFNMSACANVAPGASCNVVVTYSPTTVGENDSGPNLTVVQQWGVGGNQFSVSGVGGGSSATRTSATTLAVPATWYGGSAQTVTATYRNDGNLPMTLAMPSLAAPLSVTSNNCSGVAAGASCSVVVTAATNVPGISMSQSFAPTGANVAPASTTVTWTTQTAVPHWGSTSLSFGTVLASTSSSQNITLINDGNVTYNWAGGQIWNAPAGYSFNTAACASVAPGGSCNVVVTFSPSTFGTTYSGSSISMIAASYNTNTFSVTGVGGGSSATLTSAAKLVSPPVWYLSPAQTVTATYRNDGNQPMTLASPSLASPLSVSSNNCSSVAAGSSCSIVVQVGTFVPGLSVSQSFTPSGANVAPAATTVTWTTQTDVPQWSPTSLTFGNVEIGASASQNITLTNMGNIAYNWAANNTMASLPPGYLANTSACSNVAPSASCNVVITFTPTLSAGAYSASGITMVSKSYDANYFSVSGAGLTAPTLVASPSSFSGSTYAPQVVSTTIAFSNTGQWPTTFNLSMTGGASVSPTSLSCPVNGTCGSVTVTTPTAVGNYSGTLTGTSSAGGSVPSVPMTMIVQTAPAISTFTIVSSTTSGTTNTTTFQNPNSVAVTPSTSGISVTKASVFGGATSNTCTGSIAAGGTCTIVITASAPDCKLDNYSAHSYVTDSGGTAVGSTIYGTTTKTICN